MPAVLAVAVNVTDPPEQIVVDDEVIDMVGVMAVLTVMEIELEVADGAVAQGEVVVMVQVTISPLLRPVVVNVGSLVPAGLLLTSHW